MGQEVIRLAVVDTGITCRPLSMKIDYTLFLVNAFDVVKMKCLEAHAYSLKSMASE